MGSKIEQLTSMRIKEVVCNFEVYGVSEYYSFGLALEDPDNVLDWKEVYVFHGRPSGLHAGDSNPLKGP